MRYDLQIISSWIEPGSRVLDLGCGNGDLLHHLAHRRRVRGAGIEIDEEKASRAIQRGLTVIQGDIDQEIQDYPDRAFDYVVLSQTLQQVYHPPSLIRQMLRVGRRGIVSFPNFSHWRIRLQLMFTGRAPVSPALPYQWYDTPNIRVITLKDFHRFSRKAGYRILREVAINSDHHAESGRPLAWLPNWRATYGIFLIGSRR